jgi:yecA family protein
MMPDIPREEVQVFLQNFALTKAGQNLVPYYELEGILFAVAVSPVMLPPSQWFDLVWTDGEQGTEHENMEQAEMFHQALMSLYNTIIDSINRGEAQQACTVSLKEPAIDNVQPGAPLQQWSSGFSQVASNFAEDWDEYFDAGELEEKWVEEFLVRMVAVSSFQSREAFEKMVQRLFDESTLLEAAAKILANDFAASLQVLGMINLLIRGVDPSEFS